MFATGMVTVGRTVERPWWVRLPAYLAVLVVAYGGAQWAATAAVGAGVVVGPLTGVVLGAALLGVYAGLTRWLEGRRATEVSRADVRHLGWGALVGVGMMLATVGGIAALGGFRVLGAGSVTGAAAALGFWVVGAVGEELLFRAVLFRIVEEPAGTWAALGLSAVVFGALHLVTPGATVAGGVAIALEAGFLLGAAYVLTRSLWLPIGIHLAWNFTQGSILGGVVSGNDVPADPLLRTVFEGSPALTGGTFGPEASVAAVVVGLAVSAVLLRAAHRRGRILAPARARR